MFQGTFSGGRILLLNIFSMCMSTGVAQGVHFRSLFAQFPFIIHYLFLRPRPHYLFSLLTHPHSPHLLWKQSSSSSSISSPDSIMISFWLCWNTGLYIVYILLLNCSRELYFNSVISISSISTYVLKQELFYLLPNTMTSYWLLL